MIYRFADDIDPVLRQMGMKGEERLNRYMLAIALVDGARDQISEIASEYAKIWPVSLFIKFLPAFFKTCPQDICRDYKKFKDRLEAIINLGRETVIGKNMRTDAFYDETLTFPH